MKNKELLFKEDREQVKLSQEEVYFEWWCEELKSAGLVSSFSRAETFLLRPPLTLDTFQHYKTKQPLIKQVNVLRDIRYTPDYVVYFRKEFLGKLFAFTDGRVIFDAGRDTVPGNIWQDILFLTMQVDKEYVPVYFDVKPSATAIRFSGSLGSSRDFPIKQRLMLETHNIFVNKVVPYKAKTCLFSKTFYPKRYKWTDGGTMIRKIKDYEKEGRTLAQYLEIKNIKY